MKIFTFTFSLTFLLLLNSCAIKLIQTNEPDSNIRTKLNKVNSLLNKVENYLDQGSIKKWYYNRYLDEAQELFNQIKSDPTYSFIKYNYAVESVRDRLINLRDRVTTSTKGLSPASRNYLNAINKFKIDYEEETLSKPIRNNLKAIQDYLYKSDKYLTQGILWKSKKEYQYAETFWNQTIKLQGFNIDDPEISKIKIQMEELKGDIQFEENMNQ